MFLLFFLITAGWFIYAQITLPSERNPRDYEYTTFDEDWYQVTETGDRIPIEVPGTINVAAGQTATLEKTIPYTIKSNSWLCFRTSRQDIYIYVDGELRESFSTHNTSPFGLASTSKYLFVELHTSDIGKTMTIQMSSESAYSGVVRSILFGDKTGILFGLLMEHLPILILAMLMLAASCACIIVTFILEKKTLLPIHLKYLSWSILAVSVWIITQSKVKQFYFSNVSASSSFSIFVILLIPVPFSIYMNSIQQNRYRIFYRIYEIVALIHYLICTFLVACSTLDQTYIDSNIYFIIGVLILIILVTVLLDWKHGHIGKYRFIAVGLFGVLLASIIQLLQALNRTTVYTGSFLCIGFLFLLIMASIQTAVDIIVDNYETHHIEGTGLGLSIVHNLVNLMHGEIHVDSTYGKGSTFTVTLPQGIISELPIGDLSDAYRNVPAISPATSLLAPDARILVVDDIPVNLKVFSGLLKETMVNVDTASSGREGLMKIRSGNYDLIFLDHMMPDMDGIQVLKLIKDMAETRKQLIPVIMLTANAIHGAKEEYLQKGFDDYLPKPIQKEKLFKMIMRYLPEELQIKQEKQESHDTTNSLKNLSFLDTESGLSYHGGDVELYLDILQMIYDSHNDVKLQQFFEEKDWPGYQVLVHSIKGASKSIGAEAVSYNALMLEDAAKKKDYDYILAHHATFMEDYQSL